MNFVAPYILDSLVIGYQKALSGSEVEADKVIGSSVSITDNGATANLGIARVKGAYGQITISGKGKDNFINLLEKGQYGNTISIGGQVQIFGNSAGKFYPSEANRLHNGLKLLQTNKGTYAPVPAMGGAAAKPATAAYDAELTYLFGQITNLVNGNNVYDNAAAGLTGMTPAQQQAAEDFAVAADTLMKLGMLPKNFLKRTNTSASRLHDINALNGRWTNATTGSGPDASRLRFYLADAETTHPMKRWTGRYKNQNPILQSSQH